MKNGSEGKEKYWTVFITKLHILLRQFFYYKYFYFFTYIYLNIINNSKLRKINRSIFEWVYRIFKGTSIF